MTSVICASQLFPSSGSWNTNVQYAVQIFCTWFFCFHIFNTSAKHFTTESCVSTLILFILQSDGGGGKNVWQGQSHPSLWHLDLTYALSIPSSSHVLQYLHNPLVANIDNVECREKSRIRETSSLSTDVESRTDTILKRLREKKK